MSRYLCLCLLSLFSVNGFSQHTQLSLSDEFKIKEGEYKNQTVANSVYYNNFFYTATNSGIGSNYKWLFTKLYDMNYAVTISKFDRNMNKVGELQLENGDKVFGPLQPKLLLVNNRLCLVYFKSDNKASFSLFLSMVDDSSLTLKGTKQICTIRQENVGISKLESIIKGSLVFITNAPDNNKTLIACKASPNTIQTFVVDAGLNILKKTEIHTSEGFDISTGVLTNDNLECLILHSEQETKLLCVNPQGTKSEIKITASSSARPYQVNATPSADGKYIYIYSSNMPSAEDEKGCTGFFLSQLDCGTQKLSKPVVYQFSPEFIETMSRAGGGTRHKKDYLMYNFSANLVELDNGEVAILGCPEETTVTTSFRPGFDANAPMREIVTTTLHVGPILAFFPNTNGKTFDYALIPRKSSMSLSASGGTGPIQFVQALGISNSFAGFSVTKSDNDIIVIYDDNEDNLLRGENEKIVESHSTKNIVLAEALINKDKKLEYRKQIGKNMSGALTYFLGSTVPASTSSLVFPVARQGVGFNARKIVYSNWCFLDIK